MWKLVCAFYRCPSLLAFTVQGSPLLWMTIGSDGRLWPMLRWQFLTDKCPFLITSISSSLLQHSMSWSIYSLLNTKPELTAPMCSETITAHPPHMIAVQGLLSMGLYLLYCLMARLLTCEGFRLQGETCSVESQTQTSAICERCWWDKTHFGWGDVWA